MVIVLLKVVAFFAADCDYCAMWVEAYSSHD
jgi:hypothetical protein